MQIKNYDVIFTSWRIKITIISRDAERSCPKTQSLFMIKKIYSTMGIEGTLINIIKKIYEKPMARIVLRAKNSEAVSLRTGTKDIYCHLWYSILPWEFWTESRGKKRESNRHKLERRKPSYLYLMMTWFLIQWNQKDLTEGLMGLMSEFGNTAK